MHLHTYDAYYDLLHLLWWEITKRRSTTRHSIFLLLLHFPFPSIVRSQRSSSTLVVDDIVGWPRVKQLTVKVLPSKYCCPRVRKQQNNIEMEITKIHLGAFIIIVKRFNFAQFYSFVAAQISGVRRSEWWWVCTIICSSGRRSIVVSDTSKICSSNVVNELSDVH